MSAATVTKALNQLLLFTALFSLLLSCGPASASQAEVDAINSQIWTEGAQWQAGVTSVSRLPLEIRRKHNGLIKPASLGSSATSPAELQTPSTGVSISLPESLDYRNYNVVTSVKDQGSCGSCWAFAATAAAESQVAMDTGSLVNLSEQILLSCSNAGNCEAGGYIDKASSFIQDTGLPVETCFLYTATDNSCSNAACPNWRNSAYAITGWTWIAQGPTSATNLKNALYAYGPIVVTMEVFSDFDHYMSGIYSRTAYSTDEGGHAIELIGYNDSGQFFICKNSWGTGWGESGFFRIAYSQIGTAVKFGQYAIAYTGYRVPTFYQLSVQKSGDGSGTITSSAGGINCGSTCTATYSSGTQVTLSAALNSGSRFGGWTGCPGVVDATTCTVTMNAAQSVTAHFVSSSENPSSFLYGSFGSDGIWMWDGTAWGKITSSNPRSMAAIAFSLYGDFGSDGIWEYDGSAWNKISSAVPAGIAASDSYLYGSFSPKGIWKYNGTPFSWTPLTASNPVSMTVSGSDTLYGNFNLDGIWQYSGTPLSWTKITASRPVSIVASDSSLFGDFSPDGIWKYNGTSFSWTQITTWNPVNIATSGSTLYGNFSPNGIWKYNGTEWTQITASNPVNIAASDSSLYGNFSPNGIWKYYGGSWTQITISNPTNMAAPK